VERVESERDSAFKGRRRCQDESDQQDTARRDSRIVASYHVFRYRPCRGRIKYINQATIIDTLVTRGPWSSLPSIPNSIWFVEVFSVTQAIHPGSPHPFGELAKPVA
jgi:hypothetical protein